MNRVYYFSLTIFAGVYTAFAASANYTVAVENQKPGLCLTCTISAKPQMNLYSIKIGYEGVCGWDEIIGCPEEGCKVRCYGDSGTGTRTFSFSGSESAVYFVYDNGGHLSQVSKNTPTEWDCRTCG